jgi:AcrR family transcriptional regulator
VTPRSPAPSKAGRDGAGSLSRLLDGAQQVFAERGYNAATVHDICARASVGIGTFYAHFDDKTQLLKQLMSERAVTLPRQLKASDFTDSATLAQRLVDAVGEPVAVGMWRAWHEAVLGQSELVGFQRDWKSTALAEMTELIREARRTGKTRRDMVDPGVAAWAVMSLAREFAIHDREYRPDMEGLAKLMLTLVLGAAADSRPSS